MQYLRQSTATAIPIGPFIDEDDGKTPETGLTVTGMDVDLYKHSNTHPLTKTDLTITASGGSNDCAHVANGYYSLELTATDTGTLGRFYLTVNISGAIPVWHEYMVIPANEFDSLILGTDALDVELASVVDAAANKIADHVIRRSFQNACDSSDGDTKAFRSLLGAVAKQVNKVAPNGSNIEIFEDDDTTVLGTQAVTTSPSADPITALDTT
jgi:hypothetical protein